ncbi:MAG: zinc ABC transporter substrate-binding protein [Chlamydiota bacterium]
MKKGLGVIGALLAIWLMITCLGSKEKSLGGVTEKNLVVLSTTAMICDIVDQVGGERVHATTLIQGAIDPHSYELVKGDDEKIDGADLVFFNGLHLEHGASLQYKLSSHPKAVSVGDYILSNYPDSILYEEGQPDPHIWMDISLWVKIIEPVVEGLSEKDPEGKEYYMARGVLVKEKMLRFHSDLKAQLQKVPEHRRYLVTSHDAFGYFTRSYLATEEDLVKDTWKKRFAAPEGLAPDGQLGVMDLQKIVDYLAKYQVGVVFPESNVSRDSLKKIVFACKEKHLAIRFSHNALYGDCMGISDSYLDMIGHNGAILIKEWEHFP